MDATNELRFGEMRDSAVLWGQRREFGGREFDTLVNDYYSCIVPGKFWKSPANSATLRRIRAAEVASYNSMVASEKMHAALLTRNMIDHEQYMELHEGQTEFAPMSIQCRECNHNMAVHDSWNCYYMHVDVQCDCDNPVPLPF